MITVLGVLAYVGALMIVLSPIIGLALSFFTRNKYEDITETFLKGLVYASISVSMGLVMFFTSTFAIHIMGG